MRNRRRKEARVRRAGRGREKEIMRESKRLRLYCHEGETARQRMAGGETDRKPERARKRDRKPGTNITRKRCGRPPFAQ